MKKKFLMLCMILTALLFLCTLTACDETDPNVEVPEHVHTLGEWQEVLAPTCSTQGVRAKLCTVEGCQQFELELIDRLGHTYTSTIVASTCAEQGYTMYTCSVCGDNYRDEFTSLADHTMGEWTVTKAATCTEKGEESRVCSVCLLTDTRQLDASGHTHTATVVAPTCKAEGYTTYTCACGDSYEGSIVEVDLSAHDFGEDDEDLSCAHCGVTNYSCFKFTERKDGTYSVSAYHYTRLPENLVIPSEYNGKPVTRVGEGFSSGTYTSVVIPEGITVIGEYAFRFATIGSIVFPDSLREIEYAAFYDADIPSIELPSNAPLILGRSCFDGVGGLTQITIPGTARLERGAFKGCMDLTTLVVEEGVESLPIDGFSSCVSLQNISLPNSLRVIEASAFYYCLALTNIVIPANVAEIKRGAFEHSALTGVTIPASVEFIGELAFRGCPLAYATFEESDNWSLKRMPRRLPAM